MNKFQKDMISNLAITLFILSFYVILLLVFGVAGVLVFTISCAIFMAVYVTMEMVREMKEIHGKKAEDKYDKKQI